VCVARACSLLNGGVGETMERARMEKQPSRALSSVARRSQRGACDSEDGTMSRGARCTEVDPRSISARRDPCPVPAASSWAIPPGPDPRLHGDGDMAPPLRGSGGTRAFGLGSPFLRPRGQTYGGRSICLASAPPVRPSFPHSTARDKSGDRNEEIRVAIALTLFHNCSVLRIGFHQHGYFRQLQPARDCGL
jgi:hypothetical protein